MYLFGKQLWNKQNNVKSASHYRKIFPRFIEGNKTGRVHLHTHTHLSIWAALNTTSNSELSSSAAFWAITAASPRRDSSHRNWPEREREREREREIMQMLFLVMVSALRSEVVRLCVLKAFLLRR